LTFPNLSASLVFEYTFMAKSIATKYYAEATARCQNCESIYHLGSTQEQTTVEICGNCHPFYTGQEVVLDTAGRIEKFQQRLSQAQEGEKKTKVKKRRSKQSLADLSTDEETPDTEVKTKKTTTDSDQVIDKPQKKAKSAGEITETEVTAEVSDNNSPADATDTTEH
jgi:large subunit ribosomal protein L31